MRTPTSSELLQVWENGVDRAPSERVLALLALALPELGYAGLARCSIGRRDELLLALRERLFGSELTSVAHCPACDAVLETHWHADDLRAGARPAQAAQPALEWVTPAYRIAFRLPTTEDMLALTDSAAIAGTAGWRLGLLARCVSSACVEGVPVALEALPEEALAALEAGMAQADPMADIEVALQCPACAHDWSVTFDIAAFLWRELHTWAQHLLVEVHKLASAYGWAEADILAMSPGRRMLYVEMSAA